MPAMAFCKSGEFTVAEVRNFFCNFVLFHYALNKLADKYSVTRVEEACKKALSYTPRPSYKSIQTILQTGQDKLNDKESATPISNNTTQFGFTRGAGYYGGKNNG